MPDAKADLYLVGLGIGSFERRTIEVHEILIGCSTILHLTAFDNELRQTYNSEIVNLMGIYERDDNPSAVYDSMADEIFAYASNNKFLGPIAFLTYGHPLFLVDTSWDLLDRGISAGIRVKAVAATSFVDQVLCDIGQRFDKGVQLYLAENFVNHRVVVDNRFPLLLAQVGDYGSDTLRPDGDLLGRISSLFNHLGEIYPPERRAHLIFSSWRADMAPEAQCVKVGELQTIISSIHVGCSLFVEGCID